MSARLTLAIAQKEFMENVLSWRFLIALALGTLIMVTSVLALGAAYAEDQEAHAVQTGRLERDRNQAASAELQLLRVLGRPNPLAIFVGGPGDELRREEPTGGGLSVTGRGFIAVSVPSQSSSSSVESGSASPVSQRFSPLDLGFVAAVVMTFMAVIFAYDSVSGERERGTLKLMLANPVPKDVVLFGKYLGGMASILAPFSFAVLVGVATLQVKGITLSGDEWARFGLIVLLFLPLVSAFYLIGLAVSSLVRRSATSLLALTLVWLVLVFGAGNVAAVVAKETAATTTATELEDRFAEIDDRMRARLEAINAESAPLEMRRFGGNLSLIHI